MFNIIFVILAGSAFISASGSERIKEESAYKGLKIKTSILLLSVFSGSGLMILLFSFSENITHYKLSLIHISEPTRPY